jgi:cell division GTPase FtsZ
MINNDAIVGEPIKLSAAEAVKRSDAAFVDLINGLLDFISAEKRLLLDFGTIKGQLTRGGLCAWASGVSAMRNNAIEALKTSLDQFAHSRSDITKAPRALIQFAIDDDVLMDGVKNAFGVAQRVFSKDAQLAMGVVFNGVKQGKTRVSIIASGLPLFNEVVENDLAVPDVRGEFEELPGRAPALATAGSGAMRSVFRAGAAMSAPAENVRILNPRRLNDDELKIPAYLRRRMLGGN